MEKLKKMRMRIFFYVVNQEKSEGAILQTFM